MTVDEKNNKIKLKFIEFFESEKLFLPAVILHLRFHRSGTDFGLTSVTTSEDKFVPVIEQASLFVTKLIVKDSVSLSIEKALLNGPAHYPTMN